MCKQKLNESVDCSYLKIKDITGVVQKKRKRPESDTPYSLKMD